MKWRKYTVATTEEAEEAVVGALYTLGIDSIEIEDKAPVSPEANRGLFGEVLPDLPEDDHLAYISFFVEAEPQNGAAPNEDERMLIEAVRNALQEMRSYMEIGEGTITASETEDKDWINKWKEHFHSFYVDDIRIVPTWEEVPEDGDEAAMTIRIDPGMAFGTGKHESTQIAIRELRECVKEGDRVLDIGTGSGILGIIALKSGASYVFGTDIDEVAFPALEDNLANNGIAPEAFDRELCNVITDGEARKETKSHAPGGYQVVAANIIAEILADLTPFVPDFLAAGGYFITSGILREKEMLVRSAMEQAGLTILKTTYQGDWCGVMARKPH